MSLPWFRSATALLALQMIALYLPLDAGNYEWKIDTVKLEKDVHGNVTISSLRPTNLSCSASEGCSGFCARIYVLHNQDVSIQGRREGVVKV